ncbi:MAG: mandelate racemase/muconate lactonizing enzyme family protein [Armatimonadetes bacterium]|nr:mandelate racemase/muconate lactonizing enzyme family protein [Armatimonadota bacterium]
MKITQVEPLILGRSLFVRVRTDEGITGIGECSPMNAPVVAAHIEHSLAPLAVGHDPTQVELLTERLFVGTYKIAGQTQAMATSGIELACWDIAGKALGVPVWRLLGGLYRDRVPVYASSGRRNTTPEEEAADLARLVEAHGFQAVKVKIGQRWGKDEDAMPGRSLALVKECRRVLGEDVAIMVDANGAYSAPRAIALGRRFEEYGVFHFEEPCPYHDDESTAKVAAALDLPVAGGEQEWDLLRFKTLLANRVVDAIQPDAIKTGGLLRSKKIGVLAEAFGAPVTQHNTQPTIGTVAMLHFAAVCPAARTPQEYSISAITGQHRLSGLLREPDLRVEDGCLRVPDGPGLGVVLDDEKLAALRTA